MTVAFDFDAEKHQFSRDGKVIPSVTQVLAKAGICDFSFVEEETRIHAMKRGQSVHWLLQLEDEGALNYRTVPRSLQGYRRAYKTWKRRSGFYPLVVEQQFVSNFGFAGIVDRAGTFPASTMRSFGSSAVLDLKTGPIQDFVRYQLAAYCVGLEPNIYLARLFRRIALHVQADGDYAIKEFPISTFEQDFSIFIHALRSANGADCRAGTGA